MLASDLSNDRAKEKRKWQNGHKFTSSEEKSKEE